MSWFSKKIERKFKEGEIVNHKLMPGDFIITQDNLNGAYFSSDSYEVRNEKGITYNFRECEIKKVERE